MWVCVCNCHVHSFIHLFIHSFIQSEFDLDNKLSSSSFFLLYNSYYYQSTIETQNQQQQQQQRKLKRNMKHFEREKKMERFAFDREDISILLYVHIDILYFFHLSFCTRKTKYYLDIEQFSTVFFVCFLFIRLV